MLTDFFSGLLQSITGLTPPSGFGTAPILWMQFGFVSTILR